MENGDFTFGFCMENGDFTFTFRCIKLPSRCTVFGKNVSQMDRFLPYKDTIYKLGEPLLSTLVHQVALKQYHIYF